jgi:TetR/AcrR family transcriptional regulator, transcriptional repressor of aconitase
MATTRALSRRSSASTARNVKARARPGRGLQEAGASPDAAESTRERILGSAARLFAEQGFSRVSMPEIARASGITAGAIYKHFKSKADLLFQVATRALQSIPLFVQAAESGRDATALPRLAAVYTEPELKLLRQLSIEVHSAAGRDSKVRRVLAKSNRLAIERMTESVAAAQRAGKLDRVLEPKFVASAISVFIMGLTHMETLLPDMVGDPLWREFVRDRIATIMGMK